MRAFSPSGAPSGSLFGLTWVAGALAAGASVMHWIGTDTETHSWSTDAVISLVAGTALMALAILLVTGPWSVRTAQRIFLVGAIGTAIAVTAFVLPVLSAATSGHAEPNVHSGHEVSSGDPIAIVQTVRTGMELALIGVLVRLQRLTIWSGSRVTKASG